MTWQMKTCRFMCPFHRQASSAVWVCVLQSPFTFRLQLEWPDCGRSLLFWPHERSGRSSLYLHERKRIVPNDGQCSAQRSVQLCLWLCCSRRWWYQPGWIPRYGSQQILISLKQWIKLSIGIWTIGLERNAVQCWLYMESSARKQTVLWCHAATMRGESSLLLLTLLFSIISADLAVGAPFQDTGRVYIWLGSETGVSEEYSQVIFSPERSRFRPQISCPLIFSVNAAPCRWLRVSLWVMAASRLSATPSTEGWTWMETVTLTS